MANFHIVNSSGGKKGGGKRDKDWNAVKEMEARDSILNSFNAETEVTQTRKLAGPTTKERSGNWSLFGVFGESRRREGCDLGDQTKECRLALRLPTSLAPRGRWGKEVMQSTGARKCP